MVFGKPSFGGVAAAFVIAILCAWSGGGDAMAEPIRAFVAEYCITCHGEDPDQLKGETDLRTFDGMSRQDWLTLIEQIDSEEMPTKEPLPSRAERDVMIHHLVREFEALNFPEPVVQVPRVRQLTGREYANTVRDLLGIDLRAAEYFPEDGQGMSGFSNDRNALSISPGRMESLFASVERALDGAFALAEGDIKTSTFAAAELEKSSAGVKPHLKGMMVVQPTHFVEAERNFPVDGYYEFTVDGASYGKPSVADFYVAGEVVASVEVSNPDANSPRLYSVIGFVRRGRHPIKIGSRNLVPQTPLPPNFVGLIDERSRENAPSLGAFPNETKRVKELRDKLNIRATGMQESIEFLAGFGPKGDPRLIDLRRGYYFERKEKWDRVLTELGAELGMTREILEGIWEEQNADRLASNRAILQSVGQVKWEDWMDFQGKLYVENIAVKGPVLPEEQLEPHRWNLVSRLGDPVEPVTLVREFADRAFRRPVSDAELAPFLKVVLEAQRRAEDRDRAVKLALAAILVSPEFLFRGQSSESGISAADLSCFLWLSMPDQQLNAADLSDPEGVKAEMDRMIKDPRADAFFQQFADEWLEIGQLGKGIAPDRSRWPEFSIELADSMREEVHQFLAHLIRENRPVSELLTADESFVDRRLADFYELESHPESDAFAPVKWEDENRHGLLGKGAVLVTTSSPARTNPVRRGKWVWENLLGLSVGEPLADAGELPGDAGEARGKTLREELAQHSTRAECARCHVKIDPIGFGLQNFDATGRWRDLEAGRTVDAKGELFGGGEFSGPVELRELLLETRGNELARNVAGRLRALFRGIENETGYLPEKVSADTGLLDLLKSVVIDEIGPS